MARTCRRQSGAIKVDQLYALGFSKDEISRLVAGKAFTRRHRGVLLDARTPTPPRGFLFAALLSFEPGAFFSHRTAAALHGLRPLNLHAIEVTVVADHTPRHPGLVGHRTSHTPYPDEITTRDGLRTSAIHRLLLELAPTERPQELRHLIAEAARSRRLHLNRINRMLRRHKRHPGAEQLRAAIQTYQPAHNDKSKLEKAFAAWLATLPGIPPPQRGALLDKRYEIDFLWPEQRLAVELDGWPYHSLPDDLERDRIKDVWLQRNAFHIVRVTGERFDHDRSGIESDLRHFLAA